MSMPKQTGFSGVRVLERGIISKFSQYLDVYKQAMFGTHGHGIIMMLFTDPQLKGRHLLKIRERTFE